MHMTSVTFHQRLSFSKFAVLKFLIPLTFPYEWEDFAFCAPRKRELGKLTSLDFSFLDEFLHCPLLFGTV